MKYLKRLSLILATLLTLTVFTVPILPNTAPALVAEAHSGRTDASGGHRDNKNASGLGYYHYHCGGHPAHLHPNGVCPYASGSGTAASSSTGASGSTGNAGSSENPGNAGNTAAPAVTLSQTSAVLTEGKTLRLKVNNTTSTVKWTSSRKSVATVTTKGKVTAKKKGTATITASVDGKKYKCKITVTPLCLNMTKAFLNPGQKTVLSLDTGKKIKWASSDSKVASVTSKGKVTAKKAGKARITATVGKKSYSCLVTVTDQPIRIIPE